MTWLDLRPFAPGPPAVAVSTRASRSGHVLTIDYRLDDPWDAVRLAAGVAATRADRLWEHTCFEAFVAAPGSAAYWEANLANDGCWNVWRFDGYRDGMRPDDRIASPVVATTTGDGTIRLTATVDLTSITELHAPELALGLAVVVEANDGTLSYWAASHPRHRPDFHLRDGFSIRLAEPRS